jgi:hypothetical protein
MHAEDYDKLIEQLRSTINTEEATFGIFQYGGGTDECCIKANKEGLQLYALELLMAAQKTEEGFEDPEKQIIPISYQENWIDGDSDVLLQYIDPAQKRAGTAIVEQKSTLHDKLVSGGCFLLFVFIVLSVLVGAVNIIKWIL